MSRTMGEQAAVARFDSPARIVRVVGRLQDGTAQVERQDATLGLKKEAVTGRTRF